MDIWLVDEDRLDLYRAVLQVVHRNGSFDEVRLAARQCLLEKLSTTSVCTVVEQRGEDYILAVRYHNSYDALVAGAMYHICVILVPESYKDIARQRYMDQSW